MRVGLLLAGAAVAAVLLTAGTTVVLLATDPVVQECAAANSAVFAANSANQDALKELDRALPRSRRDEPAPDVEAVTLRARQAQAELDAARARFELACHYGT